MRRTSALGSCLHCLHSTGWWRLRWLGQLCRETSLPVFVPPAAKHASGRAQALMGRGGRAQQQRKRAKAEKTFRFMAEKASTFCIPMCCAGGDQVEQGVPRKDPAC